MKNISPCIIHMLTPLALSTEHNHLEHHSKQGLDYSSSHWSLFWSYSLGLGICYITQGSFELSVLSLARPVLVPEIKEVVSHKYKTPMVSMRPSHSRPKHAGLPGNLPARRVDPRGGLDARGSTQVKHTFHLGYMC